MTNDETPPVRTPDEDTAAALKLWVVINRAHRAIWAHDRRDVLRHGLQPTEFAVLEVLYNKGSLTLGEVGDKVLLTSGSTTHVINKLEERGLLRRRMCEDDRRVYHAELTDDGRRLVAEIFPAHAEALREALAGLTTREKKMAIDLIKRLGRFAAASLR